MIGNDTIGATESTPITLQIVGEARAGRPAQVSLASGQAIAISTGAALPAGSDATVRLEETTVNGQRIDLTHPVDVGCDVRQIGEDYQVGMTLLKEGERIGPEEIGVIASLGLVEVECAQRPRVAVVTTGDELRDPGTELEEGEIYNSNRYAIAALVRTAGAQVTAITPAADSLDSTRAAISNALENDLILLCGGVSVGEHDHVKQALDSLGVTERFWRVAQRPGGPLWFGTYSRDKGPDTLIFGLPGNPISAMVTFYVYVRRAIREQLGAKNLQQQTFARLSEPIEKASGKVVFARVSLKTEDDGMLQARVTGPQGSHVLTSMLGADALAILPAERTNIVAGELIEVELLKPASSL